MVGVSLELLRKFAAEKDIPLDYSMAQVCTEVVKPQTLFEPRLAGGKPRRWSLKNRQIHCSYAALIGEATDSEGRPFIGKASRFVSYAWKVPDHAHDSLLNSCTSPPPTAHTHSRTPV